MLLACVSKAVADYPSPWDEFFEAKCFHLVPYLPARIMLALSFFDKLRFLPSSFCTIAIIYASDIRAKYWRKIMTDYSAIWPSLQKVPSPEPQIKPTPPSLS
jgi:hypothetical protein